MTGRVGPAPWQTGRRVSTIPLTPFLATIGDPEGTRTVTSIVVLLAALGVALLLLAVWIFRATRPDPELLAPLEAMGERAWRRADPVWQRRRLDELRPRGARPLTPSVAPPRVDEAFDAGPAAPGFDDLRADEGRRSGEVPVVTAGRDDTPVRDTTPPAFLGPTLDVPFDDDFDPDALAAAREALERELAESARHDPDQLHLFGHDRDG